MPCIVLALGVAAVLMRQMRSSMLISLGADYIRTARAKGLSERTRRSSGTRCATA